MSNLIPVNALRRHVAPFHDRLAQAAATVLDSGHFVVGAQLMSFEQGFQGYCRVDACVGVANGTDALELGLKAVGTEPGCQVAVVANAAM